MVVSTPIPNDLDDEPPWAVAYAERPMLYGVITQYDAIEAAGKAAEYTQAYLAGMTHTDAMVGQLLDALAASPHAENTDVVFWSDHGYHLGEKFHWHKMTLWEQSTKVPLLISSPGNPNYPVGDDNEPVSLLDLAPTVLDLAGVSPHPQFEGAPLHDTANRSKAITWYNGGKATVYSGGLKVVDYDYDQSHGIDDLAVYNLTDDPGESSNIVLSFVTALFSRQ